MAQSINPFAQTFCNHILIQTSNPHLKHLVPISPNPSQNSSQNPTSSPNTPPNNKCLSLNLKPNTLKANTNTDQSPLTKNKSIKSNESILSK